MDNIASLAEQAKKTLDTSSAAKDTIQGAIDQGKDLASKVTGSDTFKDIQNKVSNLTSGNTTSNNTSSSNNASGSNNTSNTGSTTDTSSSSGSTGSSSSSSSAPASLGGTTTKMNYDSLLNIFEEILKYLKDMTEQYEQVKSIIDARHDTWESKAGDKYWSTLYEGKQVNLESILEMAAGTLQQLTEAAQELVENNKNLDSKILSTTQNTGTTANDNTHASSVDTGAQGVDQTLNNQTKANDNTHASSVDTGAQGVDQTLNNQVGANNNVHSSSVDTGAKGVNDDNYGSIGPNNNVHANSTDTGAQGVNTGTIDSVNTGSNN